MPSLTRRAESSRREQIERDVLRATEDLLAAGASYSDLAVSRIAERAGISRTAFYFYFRDKRDLLVRLTEDVAGLLYAEADTWFSGDGGVDEMREALTRVLVLYGEHAVLLRAVVETSAYDAQIAESWRAIVGRFVDATRDRIDFEPAAATAFGLVWMVERACYQRLVQGEALDDPEFVEGLRTVWTRTIYGR